MFTFLQMQRKDAHPEYSPLVPRCCICTDNCMFHLHLYKQTLLSKVTYSTFRLYIYISGYVLSVCVLWELNPQPLTQCSTTEPQEHKYSQIIKPNIISSTVLFLYIYYQYVHFYNLVQEMYNIYWCMYKRIHILCIRVFLPRFWTVLIS